MPSITISVFRPDRRTRIMGGRGLRICRLGADICSMVSVQSQFGRAFVSVWDHLRFGPARRTNADIRG